ncbi:MAG: EamA family transporter [Hyphomicrobiales bacterium]|nr:MAG: EamA family transporter [Hyphomicrobiales bacterium]
MRLTFVYPALFVLIWSTGWIVAKFASPFTQPLSYLTVRFAIAGLLLALFCVFIKAKWPRGNLFWHAIASGIFLHAIYLGGVWWILDNQMPSSLSGMMAALQPLMTAFIAGAMVGERLSGKQWIGLGIGFIGLLVALAPKLLGDLGGNTADGINWTLLIAINFIAMLSVTLGTVYQKRYLQSGDLRTITTLQYLGAFLVTLPAALLLENFEFIWVPELIGAMAWSVFGLSFGAIGLLVILIREGAVSRAATLIYLIPPVIAIEAYFLFGEVLGPIEFTGMGLTVFGVFLVSRQKKAS